MANTKTKVRHPLSENALPVIGVSRSDYIEKLIARGFQPYMDAATGMYLAYPDKDQGLWVSWQMDGPDDIFFIEMVKA